MQARGALLLGGLAALWLLTGCSNGRGSVDEPAGGAPQSNGGGFSVGGTVAGLSGSGLVLRNNGGADLAVNANGGFVFSTLLANGAAYDVTVAAQPSSGGQTCAVSNGSGVINGANVANITVTCTAAGSFSIGGAVSGLVGSGLVLQNNGGDALPIEANGAFSFPLTLGAGATYSVSVATQPSNPSQTCSVTNGSGVVGSDAVTNVQVTCRTGELSIGGSVTGLLGSGLVLQLNGGADLAINDDGPFTFPTLLARGATYSVTVKTQPTAPPQSCTVRNSTGTLGTSNVTNIVVECQTGRFSIGGAVSGLEGGGLRVQINGGDALDLVNNGAFAFEESVADGAAYNVTVSRQPRTPTQVCTVANGVGVVRSGNVTNITIACTTSSFRVGGSVSGLAGPGLALRLNNVETLNVQSSGAFTFDTALRSGSAYRVSIAQQPAGQTCTVANDSGVIGGGDISNVRVACSASSFSVGGSVNGLLGSGLVLQNNGADPITINADGAFTFPSELANGANYNVTVRTQPSDPPQTCAVSRGSGAISGDDVTNIAVNCSTSEYTIGGAVRDLSGSGLVLRNGADDLAINANGSFTFQTALATGATYNVTVAQQPNDPEQTCTVTNGAGVVALSNVTNVIVECRRSGFEVGGRVSRLRGAGLVLQNNGGDNLAIGSNGRFRFPSTLSSGSPYNVTVAAQPTDPSQTCEVRDGSGTIGNRDVDDVDVECSDEDDDD